MSFRKIFLLLFLIAFISGELPLVAQDRRRVTGEIVQWIDGDTCDFKIDEGETIRVQLWLVDAPESDQPGGSLATNYVRTNPQIGTGKRAILYAVTTDKYGRAVGQLKGINATHYATKDLLASGYFWPDYISVGHLSKSQSDQLKSVFNATRADKRGIFKYESSVAPWKWRKMSDAEKEDATKQFERESGISIPRLSQTPSLQSENNSNYSEPPGISDTPDSAVRSSPGSKQAPGNESEDFVTIILLVILIGAGVVCWITWRLTKVNQAQQKSQTTSSEGTQSERKVPPPDDSLPEPDRPPIGGSPESWERFENEVFEELENKLPRSEYAIIYDALFEIEGEDRSSQIDHIVVSSYGVFVIETKAWHGKITGNETDKEWTQNVNGKFYTYYNPIRQNARHIEFLKRILTDNKIEETPFVRFVSIVVFEDSAELDVEVGNNIVIYKRQLVEAILRYKNQVTSFDLRNRIIEVLLPNLKRGKKAKDRHIDRVKGNH